MAVQRLNEEHVRAAWQELTGIVASIQTYGSEEVRQVAVDMLGVLVELGDLASESSARTLGRRARATALVRAVRAQRDHIQTLVRRELGVDA